MTDKELIRNQLHKLLDIVIDTNGLEKRTRVETGTLPTVFAEYMGHVNCLKIRICPDGWQGGGLGNDEELLDVYLEKPIPEDALKRVEAKCKHYLVEKKEQEILLRDITAQEKAMQEKKKMLRALKKQLKELEAKEKEPSAGTDGSNPKGTLHGNS